MNGAVSVVVVVSLLVHTATAAAPTIVSQQTVFHNTTRFKYMHMTMIEQVTESRFLYAFQASHLGEGHFDQRICLMTSDDGGKTFSEPVDIVWGDNVPIWGPVLFHHPKLNTTFLYFARSVPQNIRAGERHFPGGEIMVVNSTDGGRTWSTKTPQLLLPYDSPTRGNVSKMTANKPVYLNRDQTEWALPFWQEAHKTNRNDTGPLCAGVLVTQDNGRTYTPYGYISNPKTWLIENTLMPITQVPSGKGFGHMGFTLVQYFRTHQSVGWIYESVSYDGGRYWSVAKPTKIHNPDSKTSVHTQLSHDGTPLSAVFSQNPNMALNRRLLTAMVAPNLVGGNTDVNYTTTLTLANTTHFDENHYTWSYPTVLALKERNHYAVSYTAYGTAGGRLAWIKV